MDHPNRKLIEMLTPVELANELANNGYVNYHQMIIEKNIDGKEFLDFNESKVQELKLVMNNVQVQLLWSYIQRIQKYPEEFHITKLAPQMPLRKNMTKHNRVNNKYPAATNAKPSEEKRREVLPKKPVMLPKPVPNKVPIVGARKEALEKLFSDQSGGFKPLKPPVKQNSNIKPPPVPQPAKEFTNSISEELLELQRSNSIRKRLDEMKKVTGDGSFPVFPDAANKLPEIRNFSNSPKQYGKRPVQPKQPKSLRPDNVKASSKAIPMKQPIKPPIKPPSDQPLNRFHRNKSPFQNSIGVQENREKIEDPEEETIYLNEVENIEEVRHPQNNFGKITNIDGHLHKKKFEIQSEISELKNGIDIKEKIKSLQQHFQGLQKDEEEEEEGMYGNLSAEQPEVEEAYRNWQADTNNLDSDNSENWNEDSDIDEFDESSDSEENQYINHQEENNFSENNLPPTPIHNNFPSSILPPKPKPYLDNFRKSNILARPPVTLPDNIPHIPDTDDSSQELYIEPIEESTQISSNEEVINVYEPGPILQQSSALEDLIGKPNLPFRRLSPIASPQERALPEIPIDIVDITRKEAENILNKKPVGTFIFRKSREYYGALTVKAEARCFNVPIRKDVRGLYFDTTNEKKFFKDLTDLMQYYKSNDFKVHHANIRLITHHVL